MLGQLKGLGQTEPCVASFGTGTAKRQIGQSFVPCCNSRFNVGKGHLEGKISALGVRGSDVCFRCVSRYTTGGEGAGHLLGFGIIQGVSPCALASVCVAELVIFAYLVVLVISGWKVLDKGLLIVIICFYLRSHWLVK